MSDEPINLVSNPVDSDYEDYISAYLQAGGLYVERNVIYRGKEELLELDIMISNFGSESIDKHLVEIKSGGWGFSEIFKVKGWMVYLKIDQGIFVVKELRKSMDFFQEKSQELGIALIDNSDLSKTKENLDEYTIQPITDAEIQSIRYSYLLERSLLRKIKILRKRYPAYQCYKKLDEYLFTINSGSFFKSDPLQRIRELFNAYVSNKNITAKICSETKTGTYDEDATVLLSDCFRKLFYECENNIMQVSLYVEHMARITILKSCIEYLINHHSSDFKSIDFRSRVAYMTLPSNIQNGLAKIVKEPFFHRYPVFWQFFTYVMGGFILTDLEEAEYRYISENTGIPVDEIPNAFDSYNKLFPANDGTWLHNLPYSNIVMHRFFPPSFCGVGANHRLELHFNESGKTYDDLEKLVSGRNTMKDLIKWNNLGYEVLKGSTKKV